MKQVGEVLDGPAGGVAGGDLIVVHRYQARLVRRNASVSVASRVADAVTERTHFAVFVTLTYRPGAEWSPRHVSDYLRAVREWAERQGQMVPNVWIAELQPGRKVLHYHLVLWCPHWIVRGGDRLRLPKPDDSGMWPHGASNVQTARNGYAYLVSYAKKTNVAEMRELSASYKGARASGYGGLGEAVWTVRYYRMPQWARDYFGTECRVRRMPGGGWLSIETGDVARSRWCLFKNAPDWEWVALIERGG